MTNIFESALFASLALSGSAYAQEAHGSTRASADFDIAAQSATTAVPTFARQAGIQIMAPAKALRGVQTKRVAGRHSVSGALRLLLEGTDLVVGADDGRTITLRKRPPAGNLKARPELVKHDTESASTVGSDQPPPVDEAIIVTARRREENPIATPVILTAINGEEIATRGINNLSDVARLVPQLVIGGSQSVQGGSINLRGIGSSEANPFADQAVSFVIDGVQISRATVQRMAQMDLEQVVVYEGPQALFFGKNSPAGVIDIRSADPTSRLAAGGSLGYEFEGRELRANAFVAGPLTDSLGVRLAVYGSHLEGYVHNSAPADPLIGPSRRKLPHDREYAGRLTLAFKPVDGLDAKLKLNYSTLETAGPGANQQLVACPAGTPQLGGPDLCRPDGDVVRADLGANFRSVDVRYGDGIPYLDQEQWLASLELNADLGQDLQVTSNTSLYDVSTQYLENGNNAATPARMLASYQDFQAREIAQELRLTSQFSGSLNFMLGAFYQHSRLENEFLAAVNATAPVSLFNQSAIQTANAYSGFAQLMWGVREDLELSVGGRYSHEAKTFRPSLAGISVPTVISKRKFNDFSPEATITWRPTSEATLFASYKQGFLSGGFNAGSGDLRTDRSYDQQTIEGFEIGTKISALNGALRLNLSGYNYKLLGLQVLTQTGLNQIVSNAGKATIRGVGFDFQLRPRAIEGLRLMGALAYNRASYDVYTASCYAGQTVALGCNLNPNGAGIFQAQDLAGRPLARAPRIVGNAGFDYEWSVSGGLVAGLNGNASHSSSYFANPSDQPSSRQAPYWLFDAGLRVSNKADNWTVALIGRNLSNELYLTRINDVIFTGNGTGTGGPAVLADNSAVLARGREVMLRLTVGFGQ